MKHHVASRRKILAIIILILLVMLLFVLFAWCSLNSSKSSSIDKPDITSFTESIEGENNSAKESSDSSNLPIKNADDDTRPQLDAGRRTSTAKVTITANRLLPQKQSTPPKEALPKNTTPQLTVASPGSSTYQADLQDGNKHYKTLIFSASATDAEDGTITNAKNFRWNILSGNCVTAGANVCQSEKTGNNFAMNLPISEVCTGIKTYDIFEDYTLQVTVRDSKELTASREISLTITYNCVVDPASVPTITTWMMELDPILRSPKVYQYDPASGQTDPVYVMVHFRVDNINDKEGWGPVYPIPTWRLVEGECGEQIVSDEQLELDWSIWCQPEVAGGDFFMTLKGSCTGDPIYGPPREYLFEVSVQDGDGNVGRKEVPLTILGSCTVGIDN